MAYLWRIGDIPEKGSAAAAQPLHELRGHSDTVVACGFSPDGQFLATGGMDGRVAVWKTDGTQVAIAEDLGDAVNYLFWHPRGNMLFAGGADSQSAMWNDRGVCLQLFAGHAGEVSCGCLTLDGKLLATGSEDTTVKVFAPKTAEMTAQFGNRIQGMHTLPPHPVRSVAAHGRNADIVLAGYDDGKIALLGIAAKKVLQVLDTSHTQAVETIAFSTVLPYYATCCADGTLTIWDVENNKARHHVSQKEGFVTLAWQRDRIFTADTIGCVAVWPGRGATDTATEIWTGHSDTALCIAVQPAGQWVVSGSDDHSLRLFSADQLPAPPAAAAAPTPEG